MQTFDRTTFSTSRLMEFFTEKELQMRMGYPKALWPLVLLKELVDNSLDACENAGIQPKIEITLEPDSLSVLDNGPGLPSATLEQSLNYLVRVSDKSHYISPTRGQLGNALKCLWAAPFVADGEYGRVEVSTQGTTHCVEVTLDRIAQQPKIKRTTSSSVVKTGTFVKIYWTGIASYLDQSKNSDFYKLIASFSLINPHAHLELKLSNAEEEIFAAALPAWKKWLTLQLTSPHWYTAQRLRSLIAAYITQSQAVGRPKTVREFVAEFAGLTGTAKQKAVTEQLGLTGAYLHDLVLGSDVDSALALQLLAAMQSASRPIAPKALGIIGEANITQWLKRFCTSVHYKKAEGMTQDGLPYILEVAFGVRVGASGLVEIIGLNWSPTLKSPINGFYRLLDDCRVDAHDPVLVVVHLACPRLDFTETGKGALALPTAIRLDLIKSLKAVTKKWKQAKRHADKENRVRQQMLDKLHREYVPEASIKEAAYDSMVQAYMLASASNTLPANARQIMYAARPLVLERTGGKCWQDSSYFTQHLLPDFLELNPELTADWDVAYDARGRFDEPHTQQRTDLGTLEVRRYLHTWRNDLSDSAEVQVDYMYPTCGPSYRYAYALFIEKEGFSSLLRRADIANRYDIAIMSTKGMSVTAARRLVEELSNQDATILVLRDFDKSGFSIVNTLKSDTRRYKFDKPPKIVDLGLRLADVQELELQSEPVVYNSKVDPRINLKESGASALERNFLVRQETADGWRGERVELNAMASNVFIEWLESKLEGIGVRKIVPDAESLATSYRRAYKLAIVERTINQTLMSLEDIDIEIPKELGKQIAESINGTSKPWDVAVGELASKYLRIVK